MNSIELQNEMALAYDELVTYLQNKYGLPERAYFRTETCKSKSPITRSGEGLYVHHVKETEIDDLSKPERALEYPWEYQMPHNLCYCNYLEHLLLHIHINKKRVEERGVFICDGVLNHIIPELNHIYIDNPVYEAKNQLWRNHIKEQIIDNYEDYKTILAKWLDMIATYNTFNITLDKLLTWRGTTSQNPAGCLMAIRLHFMDVAKDKTNQKCSTAPNKEKTYIAPTEKRVRCIETGEIWDSIKEVANYYKTKNCKNIKVAIRNKTGWRNYHWEYVD